MIHRIFSDLPSFKELAFRPGLNILLAEKSPDSTERQTRNGAGKTSLIELTHFLMGSNVDKNSIFRSDELTGYTFGIDFDLAYHRTTATRSGRQASEVLVDTSIELPLPNITRDVFGTYTISNTLWRSALGMLMFNLKGIEEDDQSEKFGPTFRTLFGYFVRRQMAGGFVSPIKQTEMQQVGDQQTAISYLLGLDWTIPQQWQVVRNRERNLKELRKAAKEGAFGAVIGTTAELRTELTIVEDRARRLRERIQSFQVLPEYTELEAQASRISRQIGNLSDENTIDRELLAELEQSMQNEAPPAFTDLERLYEEVGVVLPEVVTRRFDDVRAFHESIVENRRLYLRGEIQATRQRIEARERSKDQLGNRQSEIMRLLRSHGALDQYAQLQAELARAETATETLRQRFAAAEQLEGSKTELDVERNRLLLLLQQDYREQRDTLQQAILAFQSASNALYEQAGSLTIEESLNGPRFEIKIHGAKSKGISNMQIFCFDMMLMQLCSERGLGPGFLVHDSHLFDGVDERQVGRALYVGEAMSRKLGFQYIVTMNSDAIPKDVPSGFNVEDYVLPIRLSDKTVDGGLFGLRFG